MYKKNFFGTLVYTYIFLFAENILNYFIKLLYDIMISYKNIDESTV